MFQWRFSSHIMSNGLNNPKEHVFLSVFLTTKSIRIF